LLLEFHSFDGDMLLAFSSRTASQGKVDAIASQTVLLTICHTFFPEFVRLTFRPIIVNGFFLPGDCSTPFPGFANSVDILGVQVITINLVKVLVIAYAFLRNLISPFLSTMMLR